MCRQGQYYINGQGLFSTKLIFKLQTDLKSLYAYFLIPNNLLSNFITTTIYYLYNCMSLLKVKGQTSHIYILSILSVSLNLWSLHCLFKVWVIYFLNFSFIFKIIINGTKKKKCFLSLAFVKLKFDYGNIWISF